MIALRRVLAERKTNFNLSRQPSDLETHWCGKSVPNSPPVCKETQKDLFGILLEGKPEPEPRKRLYCPPVVKAFTVPQAKKENISFLYRRVSITSCTPVLLPEKLDKMIIHMYKGCENQQTAWDDFKRKIHESEYSLISCANMVFFIHNGLIKAKGITGTASKKIKSLANEEDEIEISKVIELIDELHAKERLELYSTSPFFYSVMTPIEKCMSEMNSSTGIKYRLILSGFIFSPLLSEIGTPKDNMDFSVIF